MLLAYTDGRKYLPILLGKQTLRLCERGPFGRCDFPTENQNCDKLSQKIFSEKPPIHVFFSVPPPKKLQRLGLLG